MDIEQTAAAFFSAVENADVEALRRIYDSGARIWHNFSDSTQTKEESVATFRQVFATGRVRYEVLERHIIADRVIQRHNAHFTSRTGTTSILSTAMFITVRNGRITAIDEYVDSVQVGKVLNAE